MNYKDYYKILGVARDADAEAIKRAYRKLARKYHPDVSKEKDAEERFKDVQEAYEALRDPEKRAAYDQHGEAVAGGGRPQGGFGPGFDVRGGGPGTSGFSDFFDALFGAGRADPFSAGRTHGARRAQDTQARVRITLEEAYHGAQRTFELSAEGFAPGQRTRTIEVRIPPGARPDRRIRLRGQGAEGPTGRGDLVLEVEIAPHRHFRLEGADVHLDLPIAPWEAALGAKLSVPTLGGPVTMTLKPGTRGGERLRLRGRGLPGRPPGDQYVTVRIVTPPADTDAARAFYERMAVELPFNAREDF